MPSGERVEVPDVSYARSGDVSIAYQVVGEGPTDLVLFPFLSNLYTLWQAPRFAEFGYRLAEGRRLIVANARGVGLSDRPRGFTIESRMDDLRAVMDTVGSERPALLRHRRGRCDVRRLRCVEPRPRGAADPLRPLVAEHARRTRARGGAGQPSCATRALGPPRCAGAVRRRAQPAVGERSRLPRLVRLAPPAHVEPFLVGRLQAHANRPRRERRAARDPGPDACNVEGARTSRCRAGREPHSGCRVRPRSGHRQSHPGERVRDRSGGTLPRRQPRAQDSGHGAGERSSSPIS